jgi:ribosomal protein S18 acetylase RimI-like enzyme
VGLSSSETGEGVGRRKLKNNAATNLQYFILPGNHLYLNADSSGIYNKTYTYWRDFWKGVYEKAGSPDAFRTDEMMRQNLISVLLDGENFVGCLFSTVFDLRMANTEDQYYFKFYPPEFSQKLLDRGAHRLLSVEFLTVDPAYRRSACGESYSDVVVALNGRAFLHLGLDAIIGTARNELKVNRLCYDQGYECIVPNVVRRNIEVDLIAAFPDTLRPHPDQRIAQLTETLWRGRQDFTRLTIGSETPDTARRAG